jgi:hypothetical protein
MKRHVLFFVLLIFSSQVFAEKNHDCNKNAVARAKALLRFHFGFDDIRIEVSPKATVLKPIENYANPKQMFDVLEVRGTINKGNYRMRLAYLQPKDVVPGDKCVLMGQEIMAEIGEGEF